MAPLVYTFRVALYTTLLLSTSFFAILIASVGTILGKRVNVNYYVARTFYHVAGRIMGWRFVVEGEEYLWGHASSEGEGGGNVGKGGRSAVMVGNHQSFVDIFYLGRIFPKHAAIMAKKEIKWIPGLGWWMMMSGAVFINRSNNKSAIASMHQAGEDMKAKRISLWIFPEGTRYLSTEPDLLPFKKGAFYLAVQSGVPIIPVVCQDYYHLFDGKRRFKSGTLKIKVLPPIPTTGLTTEDVPSLMNTTRDQMLIALRQISSTSSPNQDEPSTTPLLQGQHGRPSYTDEDEQQDEEETEAVLEGAVVGSAQNDENTQERRSGAAENKGESGRRKYAIAMVSDFFHPVVGGVESHIFSLGAELIQRGHRVIVITHHHPPRIGIRYLPPGLKVYHLPIPPIASGATLPNYLLFLPFFRNIILREKIQLIHAHGSLSSLGHEAIYHAPLFGVRTVFTDHSLFGFGDAVGVLTNKLLAGALRNVDAVICVSHTGRENTVLRGQIEPERVSVIPNALVADRFKPDLNPQPSDTITIVIVSRLVYRKGIDLLVASAPQICDLFPQVRFVVGGDGPKMVELEQMREKYQLQDRIELLGSIKPSDVRDVLIRGQIYLNTSLTEAFGISIIEAASCGLFPVSTRVGGVPEILPSDMIEFARADEDDVIRALTRAISVVQSGSHSPQEAHERVKSMYAWKDVAERTEAVYDRAVDSPFKDTFERLSRLFALGPIFGPILCIIIAVQHYFYLFLEVFCPRDEIEVVESYWSTEEFRNICRDEKAAAVAQKD